MKIGNLIRKRFSVSFVAMMFAALCVTLVGSEAWGATDAELLRDYLSDYGLNVTASGSTVTVTGLGTFDSVYGNILIDSPSFNSGVTVLWNTDIIGHYGSGSVIKLDGSGSFITAKNIGTSWSVTVIEATGGAHIVLNDGATVSSQAGSPPLIILNQNAVEQSTILSMYSGSSVLATPDLSATAIEGQFGTVIEYYGGAIINGRINGHSIIQDANGTMSSHVDNGIVYDLT
ncbi:MAG: hypothetical protein LBT23_05615, partial [Synergistaceae bacterium]|nr:hypothetical protein [Synergistaceae bacterium]